MNQRSGSESKYNTTTQYRLYVCPALNVIGYFSRNHKSVEWLEFEKDTISNLVFCFTPYVVLSPKTYHNSTPGCFGSHFKVIAQHWFQQFFVEKYMATTLKVIT